MIKADMHVHSKYSNNSIRELEDVIQYLDILDQYLEQDYS